jgi:PAS domain-containing protein
MTGVQPAPEPEGTIADGDIDLFELAATGTVIIDRGGVFRRVNPAFAALLGRARRSSSGAASPR